MRTATEMAVNRNFLFGDLHYLVLLTSKSFWGFLGLYKSHLYRLVLWFFYFFSPLSENRHPFNSIWSL